MSVKKYKKDVVNPETNTGLNDNPFISNRKVEVNLIEELLKINTMDLNKTSDVRYGNGKCSDFELFENKSKRC